MAGTCYDKAVELLGRRAHSRSELQRKLAARGFASGEVEAALERAAGSGYLDDRRFAAEFVRQRLERGPVGGQRLRAELARRGVAAEDSEAALTDLLPADESEAARRAAKRWRGRSGGDRAALGRYLHRQGFSRHAIFAALEGPDEVEAEHDPWSGE